jgi:anti-anti-sigma regulatory factor
MSTQHTVTYRRRGNCGHIAICGVADIFEASEIHRIALKAAGDKLASVVSVDLAKLERMDLSTVQTLTGLKACLECEGRAMKVVCLSESQAAYWSHIGCAL